MLGNDQITPQLLLSMAAGVSQGDNLTQGMGNMFGNASNIMQVQKQEQQVKQAENVTRSWLQKQFPNEDMSQMPAPMMRLYAEQAFKQKFAPAEKAEFKSLPDGTYGAWDGQKFNVLGKAEKPEDIPAAYKDWQLQQKDPAYAEHVQSTSKTGQTYEERKKIAEDLGIKPGDERYEPYVATGKFPREDQQRMTAGDKAQLYELQDKIDANKQVISNLSSLIEGPEGQSLNDRAGSGYWAKTQAFLARNDPTGLMDKETGEATTEFDNTITQNTLGQLKSVFGSAPTEGERIVLRELEASVDKTPAERKLLIKKAVELAKVRLSMAEERAASIKDETFYQPANPATVDGANTTSTGVKWKVPGQ